MEPLLTNPEDVHWVCWLSHVKLVNFVLQHVYDSSVDKDRLRRLVKDHLEKFEAVEAWQEYGKPKLHLVTHLEELFDDVGVFRAAWCMWGEAFVQVLKRMFDMTNYKNATTSVHTFWLYKAVQHWKDPKRAAWYSNEVEAASDFHPVREFPALAEHSVLIRVLLQNMTPYSVRFLRSVTRHNDEIKLNDWIIITDESSVIGKLTEMVQANTLENDMATSYIRLWVVNCATPITDASGHMRISKSDAKACMYVQYDKVQISLVSHTEHTSHDSFY